MRKLRRAGGRGRETVGKADNGVGRDGSKENYRSRITHQSVG